MRVHVLDVASALVTNGQFTPFRAVSKLYSRAEFRTALTPPISIDVASLDARESDSSDPHWILKFLRPTLELTGPEGTKVIAPAGAAGRSGGVAGAIVLAGLFALPFWVGTKVSRRRR